MTYILDNNNDIIAHLKQREAQQSQLIAMSGALACVTTTKELNNVVNTIIKNTIGLSRFMICIESECQQVYKLFYHNNAAEYTKHKGDSYSKNMDIFTSVINAPEPVILSRNDYRQTAGIPSCIKDAFQENIVTMVCCALPSKQYKGVLFIGFEKGTPQRNSLHLIKMLLVQLSITLANIILLEKIITVTPEAKTGALPSATAETVNSMGIIGNSQPMHKVRSLIQLVSNTNSGVLIQGESGTGKELVANAVHYNSDRHSKPFIKINCAAIPHSLLESELFGHEKGSFTGAVAKKIGKFELAHTGTLFLDDVCEMPLELQVKLLRALQEKEIQRIGGTTTITVDTRIIAATNKDLQDQVTAGNFRADLFYRLNVFPINIPPLRERLDDMPHLVRFFIHRYCTKNKRPVKTIAARALNALSIYHWPGNVRELEHAIERAVLLSPDKVIKEVPVGNQKPAAPAGGTTVIKPWNEFEKEYILTVLKFCKGKVSGPNGAASLLDMPPTTLNSKMEKLGIKKRHYLLD